MDNSDQTRSTMFLTEEEVRELTGISRGSRGRNGHGDKWGQTRKGKAEHGQPGSTDNRGQTTDKWHARR